MTVYLKACQKCGGDVAELNDKDGDYFDCVQCGSQPSRIIANFSRQNAPLSIDENIELLLRVSGNKLIPIATETLERRLLDLQQHGYIRKKEEKNEGNKMGYAIMPDGENVIGEYLGFVKKVDSNVKSIKGNTFAVSYELVDEDGNLTLFGVYVIKASPTLSKFVDDMYPMATLSIDGEEIAREKGLLKKASNQN